MQNAGLLPGVRLKDITGSMAIESGFADVAPGTGSRGTSGQKRGAIAQKWTIGFLWAFGPGSNLTAI